MSKNRFGARNDFIYHQINGDNIRVSDSRVVNGIYLNMPFPHLIKSRKKQSLSNIKVLLLKESVYIESKKLEEYSESNIGASIRLIPQNTNSKEFITKLKECIKEWKKLGIQLVVSQKVIEKSIQIILANEGILCLERISAFNFDNFKRMSGCTPLSSIFSDLTQSEIGSLTSFTEVEIGGRSCIHLSNDMTDVYSVVLCSSSPLITQEMEEVMKGLQTSLKLFISNPYVLPGGGVTEFLLAQYFKERIKYDSSVLSILDLSNELTLVTKSLETLSKTLTNNNHLILEEYSDLMKDANKSLLSLVTNEVAKHGQFRMIASFSEIPSNSITNNESLLPVTTYVLENPRKDPYFTTKVIPKQEMIIDIGICKKNALQSSFQCFGTLIQ